VNPVPVAATCEILTLPVPVFLIAMACDAELPTRVLPKLRLLTLEESKYDWVDVDDVPVPETEIVPNSLSCLLVPTRMLPLYVTAAFGLNATVIDVLR